MINYFTRWSTLAIFLCIINFCFDIISTDDFIIIDIYFDFIPSTQEVSFVCLFGFYGI